MNEYEAIFKNDVYQKKQIASGAKHLKKGSKSRKCTLPSDYLTKGQLKKMNGEVKTYKLNEPMLWKEFKTMPLEHQETYLQSLISKFGVHLTQIAKMMRCDTSSLYKYVKLNKFSTVPVNNRGRSRPLTFDELKAWEEFCGEMSADPGVKSVTNDTMQIDSAVATSTSKTTRRPPMIASDVSISFEGDLNLNDIMTYLTLVIGDKPQGRLTISYNIKE